MGAFGHNRKRGCNICDKLVRRSKEKTNIDEKCITVIDEEDAEQSSAKREQRQKLSTGAHAEPPVPVELDGWRGAPAAVGQGQDCIGGGDGHVHGQRAAAGGEWEKPAAQLRLPLRKPQAGAAAGG